MPPSCPHCDQPDVSLLRLVLMGEILRADEPLLVLLADLLHTSGLLSLAAAEPTAPDRRLPQGPRLGGAAGKAANLVGCESPRRQLPDSDG